jgi:hypothetical protein
MAGMQLGVRCSLQHTGVRVLCHGLTVIEFGSYGVQSGALRHELCWPAAHVALIPQIRHCHGISR